MRHTALRGFARGLSNLFVTSRRQNLPMTQIRTSRTRRTWAEKLMLWKRAYRSKIWDGHRRATGRGPTPEAAQVAAETNWVAGAQRAYDASRDNHSAAP